MGVREKLSLYGQCVRTSYKQTVAIFPTHGALRQRRVAQSAHFFAGHRSEENIRLRCQTRALILLIELSATANEALLAVIQENEGDTIETDSTNHIEMDSSLVSVSKHPDGATAVLKVSRSVSLSLFLSLYLALSLFRLIPFFLFRSVSLSFYLPLSLSLPRSPHHMRMYVCVYVCIYIHIHMPYEGCSLPHVRPPSREDHKTLCSSYSRAWSSGVLFEGCKHETG